MLYLQASGDVLFPRRVFPGWSISIPNWFEDAFVDGSYWHAYDETRSVSLTSLVMTEGRRAVTALEVVERLPDLPGTPVEELPPGTLGRAATCAATPPARASQVLSAILAVDGRTLVVTITSDDLDWARSVFSTIRAHPVEPEPLH